MLGNSPQLGSKNRRGAGRPGSWTLTVVSLVLAMLAPAGGAAIEVPLRAQLGDFWCWAACSEMVLDYLAGTDASNQCSLVRSVKTDPDKCRCTPPNGQSADDGESCSFGAPFEGPDYIKMLLGPVKRTKQDDSNQAPLNRAVLACEIDRRERPVIAWWKQKQLKCTEMGHLVVARDFAPSTKYGGLVLINDPMPLKMGSVYWLTWRGFSCGNGLGGHCIDYFDIKPPSTPPVTCSSEPELDPSGCSADAAEFEKVADFDAA